MIIDARGVPTGTVLHTDVCIIGSGLAALLLARRLDRAGREVVLLEAGGPEPEPAVTEAMSGDLQDSDHEDLRQVGTRRLGGAISLWGGRLLPLDPEDMVARPGRPQSWPIGWDDLAPYYREAHAALRAGAFEYDVTDAIPEAQPLLLPEDRNSVVSERKVWRWSTPMRFRHFRDEFATSRRTRLYHHALVTGLEQDASDVTTRAVVSHDAASTFVVTARTFVVAAGGIDSTRLLLASRGPGHESGIGNGTDQVGRHYMTHPLADMGRLTVGPELARRLCRFERTRDGVYARRLLSLHPEALAEQGMLNLNATFWSPDPHDPYHGDGLLSAYALTKHFLVSRGLTQKTAGAHRSHTGRKAHVGPHLRNIVLTAPATTGRVLAWSRRRWLDDRQVPSLISPGRSGVVRIRWDAEQRPEPENRFTLGRERDAYGMPRLRLRFQVGRRDREDYHRALQLLGRELSATGVARLELPSRDEFMDLRLGDGTHQMGLLRMSSTPAQGVVSPDLRIHSSPNTYVVSTAVFPTSGAAPPTLTLAALSLRLADRLAQQG